jgi:hypothetical protein
VVAKLEETDRLDVGTLTLALRAYILYSDASIFLVKPALISDTMIKSVSANSVLVITGSCAILVFVMVAILFCYYSQPINIAKA